MKFDSKLGSVRSVGRITDTEAQFWIKYTA